MLEVITKWFNLGTEAIKSNFKSRSELIIENIALRQQLAVLKEKKPKPRIGITDRMFWVFLRKWYRGWKNHLIIVKPKTVIEWHRKGYRVYWRWRSKTTKRVGRPRINAEIRALIEQMLNENNWGAPRIHSELTRLGFKVSQRSVSRYIETRPPDPDSVQRWKTFLSC